MSFNKNNFLQTCELFGVRMFGESLDQQVEQKAKRSSVY